MRQVKLRLAAVIAGLLAAACLAPATATAVTRGLGR
jgi:hypothetical protein